MICLRCYNHQTRKMRIDRAYGGIELRGFLEEIAPFDRVADLDLQHQPHTDDGQHDHDRGGDARTLAVRHRADRAEQADDAVVPGLFL